MAGGVRGRFTNSDGRPLAGLVRLSPVGGQSVRGDTILGPGVVRVPLDGDGWCHRTGLDTSVAWRVEPRCTVEGHGVEFDPWTLRLTEGATVNLFNGTPEIVEPPVTTPGGAVFTEVEPGLVEVTFGEGTNVEGV